MEIMHLQVQVPHTQPTPDKYSPFIAAAHFLVSLTTAYTQLPQLNVLFPKDTPLAHTQTHKATECVHIYLWRHFQLQNVRRARDKHCNCKTKERSWAGVEKQTNVNIKNSVIPILKKKKKKEYVHIITRHVTHILSAAKKKGTKESSNEIKREEKGQAKPPTKTNDRLTSGPGSPGSPSSPLGPGVPLPPWGHTGNVGKDYCNFELFDYFICAYPSPAQYPSLAAWLSLFILTELQLTGSPGSPRGPG